MNFPHVSIFLSLVTLLIALKKDFPIIVEVSIKDANADVATVIFFLFLLIDVVESGIGTMRWT